MNDDYPNAVSLPGRLDPDVKKLEMSLEIGIVGFEYDGAEVIDWKTAMKIADNVVKLVSERSHGLVTVNIGPFSVRDCQIVRKASPKKQPCEDE